MQTSPTSFHPRSSTGTSTAKKLHQITQKYGVPLLINDRVDVALAAGVEGVHLGQDDMGELSASAMNF
ncbi:unnamed protein product [Aspergillus oryzae]|uniref:Unnamed protein product n=2 Tax=Aspergillus oryzae TaxID=5062 RepID=A0AAN4YBU2_ASPOZ|nr:unnamed protein product [Aspergillus oryzae]GMF87343.1 unnamed protein product [Aspergillus oryzae]GMG03844.1 unnamed protein product [Aspergillus oryzae]GMG23673.1 unnamed protein product [Aspergillus oryzae]GMG46715.1 unnamed protein product [Aspergillus oryzae var. brunneus]